MSGRNKILLIALAFVVIAVLQKIFLPFDAEAVSASVAVKPEVMFVVGGFELTNTILMTWVAMLILVVVFFFGTRNMQFLPGGLQNAVEYAIEGIAGLCDSVAGAERGKKFFAIVATIFLFVTVSNLIGLIPGFGPIGTITLGHDAKAPKSIALVGDAVGFVAQEEEPGIAPVLAPFFRSPSTDINTTLGIALIAWIMIQFFGFKMLGIGGYLGKFFNFKRLGKFLGGLFTGKAQGADLGFGVLDLFIGLIELVSEIAKIFAFTFRLFGNIFAGEVVLLIMSFLFLALPLVFYGFEVFVGFIQGFVFAVLTLAFMTIATTGHGSEEHH
jgi:F-type H+-transporting ATPase subunit a